MSGGATESVAFLAAGLCTCAVTPLAIRLALRTGFLDRPRGYRQHAAPTPFLGGAAVLVGVLLATALVAPATTKLLVLLACAIAMWAIGTLDDRSAVDPRWRVLAAVGAAVALSATGVAWKTDGGDFVDALITVVWVVGIVNAFNLMDNMDGACGSVGCVCAAGVGALAAIHGRPALAGLSFALAGALAGFLPWNLSRPARIFLGDGGSMLVGFLIAALTMAAANYASGGDGRVLIGGLLVALPILDTALVIVSRRRRRVRLVTGGRDHLTYRLLLAFRSPQAVSMVLAAIQAGISAVALSTDGLGTAGLITVASCSVVCGAAVIALLDSARWRPAGIAVGPPGPRHRPVQEASIGLD